MKILIFLMEINAPVLFIIFNRPETTEKVFNVIRKIKPEKLYVFADGPRNDYHLDIQKCSETRKIVENIDWNCKCEKYFSEVNLGCGPGPFTAISWVFEKEDRVIILEDDCVPALPFFSYCEELLAKYKDDTRIWIISGNNYNEEAVRSPHSYFFSKYGHSWGWATWRRSWEEMDLDMKKWPLFIKEGYLNCAYIRKNEARFFYKLLNPVYRDPELKKHIWDIQFLFAIKSNGGLSIVPVKNLVTNIGFIGTHSSDKSKYHNRPIDENYSIKSHPEFILCDEDYDKYHFKKHWKPMVTGPFHKRIIRKVRKSFSGSKNPAL